MKCELLIFLSFLFSEICLFKDFLKDGFILLECKCTTWIDVPTEARRGHRVLWSWSYRPLSAVPCGYWDLNQAACRSSQCSTAGRLCSSGLKALVAQYMQIVFARLISYWILWMQFIVSVLCLWILQRIVGTPSPNCCCLGVSPGGSSSVAWGGWLNNIWPNLYIWNCWSYLWKNNQFL